jgi:hypothetical protein
MIFILGNLQSLLHVPYTMLWVSCMFRVFFFFFFVLLLFSSLEDSLFFCFIVIDDIEDIIVSRIHRPVRSSNTSTIKKE